MQTVCPADITSAVVPFPWEDDGYLQPVIVDDPLLQLDFEPISSDSDPAVDLRAQLVEMEKQVAVYKESLAQAHQDLTNMR